MISFKRALRRPLLVDLIGQGKTLWDRFLHLAHGPASGMVDDWRDNGGGRPKGQG